MHELLLFGQIPSSRHDQVLNILASVAAMQPVPILEKHLVFKPNKIPGSAGPAQAVNGQDAQKRALQAQTQGELFYMQLVADVSERPAEASQGDADVDMDQHEQDIPGTASTDATLGDNSTLPERWTLQFRDIPEVSRQRPVTSRLMSDVPITSGDPMKFMSALDYSHTSSYLLKGHRFTHLSTNILLYRLLVPPTRSSQAPPLEISRPQLLDPSGTYMLQAVVRVQDGSKVETMTKGMNELLSLKETLKGVVEMEMGDRLALDTRVR
ncbi:hypothetical protein P7C71_g2957, partial [Lecanoromycetidae sp. Uapishka_2]